MQRPELCFEVMNDVHADLSKELANEDGYRLVGGIVSHALLGHDTVIDHIGKAIITTMESSQTIIREDGSKRDADIVLPYISNKVTAERVRQTVEESTQHQLVGSVFSFEAKKQLTKNDRLAATLLHWTSHRTIDAQGRYYYELYPLSREVPTESYEPWNLQLPSGNIIKTFSPLAVLMAYKTRSISGIRHKDMSKVSALEDKILGDPVFKEQLLDGIFTPWQQFADDIMSLNQWHQDKPDSVLPDTSQLAIAGFYIKAHALRLAESRSSLVKIAHSKIGATILRPLNGDT